MVKVSFEGANVTDAKRSIVVDGTHYVHPGTIALRKDTHWSTSDTSKDMNGLGKATFYNLHCHGKVVADAAWCHQTVEGVNKQVEGLWAFDTKKLSVQSSQ